ETGLSLGLRGAGRSYGDAALNSNGWVLDLTGFNRILHWDPARGIMTVEPGVTVEQVWKMALPDGWWPAVVSGTMAPTIGGVVAANIHGKNNFKAGPIGDHVLEFELLTPRGDAYTCSRTENSELFHAAIGGFGLLGIFTRITLQLKKVYSGELEVEAFPFGSISEMVAIFEERRAEADYLVGWVDCTAGGRHLGRGMIHMAQYLAEGVDPEPGETLRVHAQELPSKIMGVFPKSLTYLALRPFVNNPGFTFINNARYHTSRWALRGHRYRQSHAGFAFLLDYVPNWKWMYRPGALVQYQCFIPAAETVRVFETILRTCQIERLPSYLGVTKRHRPDDFLLSHAVDGYSFALDFPVTPANRERLFAMLRRLDEVVLSAGGRFYFAKDLTLQADRIARIWSPDTLETLRRLKDQCDPDHRLQTDLARRLLPELC
ncbi:MAG: FAD-binding oxidoreductase, partial [bacterium]